MVLSNDQAVVSRVSASPGEAARSRLGGPTRQLSGLAAGPKGHVETRDRCVLSLLICHDTPGGTPRLLWRR
jgi:hypothetical protein